ncbi:hypothetical protein AB0D59_39525 [Streptomyces sp. NPDC048417]|uniref:hypothetical protein n=1 Tax=Streptomyces sp. NPDC048417 TaxID=3155387 RepID=UPI0034354E3B
MLISCAALRVAEPERRPATAVALLSLAYTAYAVLAPQSGPTPGAAGPDEILAHERKDTLNLIWVHEAVRRGLDSGVLLPLVLSARTGPAGQDHRVVAAPMTDRRRPVCRGRRPDSTARTSAPTHRMSGRDVPHQPVRLELRHHADRRLRSLPRRADRDLAGLLLWYNQHRPDGDSASARGSLTSDRRVLVGCVLSATLLETAGAAAVVYGFGDRLLNRDGKTVLVLHLHHGVLFGLAIGWILASCHTTSIPVTVSHAWHALHGRLPWRIGTYLDALHTRDVLIQLGRTYQFRHAALGNRLAQRLPELRNSAPTDL